MSWANAGGISSKQFTCGHCGNVVATHIGFYSNKNEFVYICPHCDKPTHYDSAGKQYPDVAPGGDVAHLPADLAELYKEARNCVAASAYTGAVLLCRKLLMNIGVKQGAEQGKSFIFYVDYLADKGYIPPNGRGWVDHIRKKGNEAAHEIKLMQRDDCDDLIAFTEMLMKFIYEFPNKIPQLPKDSHVGKST